MLTKTIQGAEIFDVALCGGGDPNQGYTNTAVQFSAGAVGQVKAAILMGAPTYVYGLSYDVGTCRAGGVSSLRPKSWSLKKSGPNDSDSSTRARPASSAHLPPRFRATATRQIPTAAMGTMQPRTMATALSTDPRPLPLSRASSVAAVVVPLAPRLPPQRRRRLPRAVEQTVPLCTANVVVKGGLARLAALLEHARLLTVTTLNACRWSTVEGDMQCCFIISMYIMGSKCTYSARKR